MREFLSRRVHLSSRAIGAGNGPAFLAPRFCYEDRALFPRHSFAEINRMHGQKPLRSPGAWHEYLSAAWLPARCPHVHITRASSVEAAAGRPRTPATCFGFGKFLLATVPLSLYPRYHSCARGFVPLSLALARANIKAPKPCSGLGFLGSLFDRDESTLVRTYVALTTVLYHKYLY